MSLILNNSPFFDLFDAFGANNKEMQSFFEKGSITPPVDLVEKEKQFELHASIPGAKVDDLSIDYNNESKELKIAGTIPERNVEKNDNGHYYKEIQTGSFQRTVRFSKGANVDDEHITADYKNGVLSIVVPKLEPKANVNKRIKIGVTSNESTSSKL